MYASQAQIEAYLNRDLTSNEEIILPLLASVVDAYIDLYQGGSYGSISASTRTYDGGEKTLVIDPCRDVTDVDLLDYQGDVVREYVLGEEVVLHPENETIKTSIERRGHKFPGGVNAVRITAKHNLGDSAPNTVVFMETYMLAQTFKYADQQGLKSESIEGYSRVFGSTDWLNDPVLMAYTSVLDKNILL